MTLPVRPLGTTGMSITPVGLGAWAMGGAGWAFAWGAQDDAQSIATIHHAIDFGVNWIDTAAQYGLGHSETVVRRALREVPASERPFVFTKCGMVWDPTDPMLATRRDLSPASIRLDCEGSLRRLGVERIDLYQCHWPDEMGTPVEDSWGEMNRLVEEGKVRAAGVSNFPIPLLDRCEALHHVACVQPPFSLIRRQAMAEIQWCQRRNTGVICYSPMQSGLLTDHFDEGRARSLPADDWRRRASEFTPPRIWKNLQLRDALRPIAARHHVSVSAVAVAWAIACPGVTGAIVGARTPDQVDGWVGAARLSLTGEDLQEISAMIRQTGAGDGPVSFS